MAESALPRTPPDPTRTAEKCAPTGPHRPGRPAKRALPRPSTGGRSPSRTKTGFAGNQKTPQSHIPVACAALVANTGEVGAVLR